MIDKTEAITSRAKTLESLGLSIQESKILSALVAVKASARDLERALDLRQPEVSLWTKNLQARGWIREGEKISVAHGRPCKTYELAMSFESILKEIKLRMEKQHQDQKEKLSMLTKKRK